MSEAVVSVIVSVRNEVSRVEQCLQALIDQDFKSDYELIFVDGMSDDGTFEILQAAQDGSAITLLRNQEENAAAGRNLGIAQAEAQLLAFVDGDAVPCVELVDSDRATFASAVGHRPCVLRLGCPLAVAKGSDG